MAVFKAKDLSTLKCDGILGLSPKEVNPNDPHRVQLFVRQLKERGVISRAMFSLVIADEEFVSKVYFGGYD